MYSYNFCCETDDGFEVMVWVGSGASVDERHHALNYAAEYLKSSNKSMCTPISKMFEGGESDVSRKISAIIHICEFCSADLNFESKDVQSILWHNK